MVARAMPTLGNVNKVTAAKIYQQVTVPSNATLSFWLNTVSNETTTTAKYDYLYVEVTNTAGTVLGTLGTYSNLDKTTAGTYVQKSFSLAAYAGQTVRVQFRATTDSSMVTTFRLDDVGQISSRFPERAASLWLLVPFYGIGGAET